jgi:hypothetical protein
MVYVPGAALMTLVARLFPLRVSPEFAHLSREALRRRYRTWDWFGVAIFLVMIVPAVYGVHDALVRYARSQVPAAEGAVHVVVPDAAFWYVPASFIAVILTCVLVAVIYRVVLRARAREYRFASNVTAGFDATRMFVVAGVVFGVAAVGLAYFAAHSSLQLTRDAIVMRRLWSLHAERYPYASVRALREVPSDDGRTVHFVIELDGARPWTTAVEIVFPDEAAKVFLSQQSGKTISATPH